MGLRRLDTRVVQGVAGVARISARELCAWLERRAFVSRVVRGIRGTPGSAAGSARIGVRGSVHRTGALSARGRSWPAVTQ